MSIIPQQFGEIQFVLLIGFSLIERVFCGLQPYYLNFPPPVLAVPNDLGDFSYSVWSHKQNDTLSRGGHLPSGPTPFVLHTWVKPDNSEGAKLQNGTVVYYLGGPWGGIRSSSPNTSSGDLMPPVNPVSNSLSDVRSSSPITGGWNSPVIDITTPPPPPTRQQTGPWGHGHLGFGWPSSTQLYDKIPETTSVPTRNLQDNSTSPPPSTTTTRTSTTTTGTTRGTTRTTTTVDPVAENTNSRYPVSDSVRKFRRIVAQIRAITKKELGAESREARREQRRRERLLRNRSNNK